MLCMQREGKFQNSGKQHKIRIVCFIQIGKNCSIFSSSFFFRVTFQINVHNDRIKVDSTKVVVAVASIRAASIRMVTKVVLTKAASTRVVDSTNSITINQTVHQIKWLNSMTKQYIQCIFY